MRRKARRADKDDESGNRGDEKGSECVNEQRGDHIFRHSRNGSPLKNCVEGNKEKPLLHLRQNMFDSSHSPCLHIRFGNLCSFIARCTERISRAPSVCRSAFLPLFKQNFDIGGGQDPANHHHRGAKQRKRIQYA